MKVYLIRSISSADRETKSGLHGVFESLKLAKEALDDIWHNYTDFDGEPTHKYEQKWIQRWGDGFGDLNGYILYIEEIDTNRKYLYQKQVNI